MAVGGDLDFLIDLPVEIAEIGEEGRGQFLFG